MEKLLRNNKTSFSLSIVTILHLGIILIFKEIDYIIVISSIVLVLFSINKLKEQKTILHFMFSYLIFVIIIILSSIQLIYEYKSLKQVLKFLLIINLIIPIFQTLRLGKTDRKLIFRNSVNHILFSFILISTINQ